MIYLNKEIKLIPAFIEKPVIKYRSEFALVTKDGKFETHSSKVTFSKKKGKAWGYDSKWTQRSMNIPKGIKDLSQTFVFFEKLEDGSWSAVFVTPIGEYDKLKPFT